jgi:hypothetical protein
MTGYEGRIAGGFSVGEQEDLDRDSLAMLPCPSCKTPHFQFTHKEPQLCHECEELTAANGGVMP